MIRWVLFITLIFASVPAADNAQAEGFAEVTAALRLADHSVETENASLLISALEILSAHNVAGEHFTLYQENLLLEARFLARGDVGYDARLERIIASKKIAPGERKITFFQGVNQLPIESDLSVVSIAVQTPALLERAVNPILKNCMATFSFWDCDGAMFPGQIELKLKENYTGWILLETRPNDK